MHFGQERRATERKWANIAGLISVPGLRGIYSCGLRDLGGEGAGLRLYDIALLPTYFKASFDGVNYTFGCRLIWRDGDFAGIAFQPARDR